MHRTSLSWYLAKSAPIFLKESNISAKGGVDTYRFGVSHPSISRWKRNVEIHGSVVPPPNPVRGRPCTLNPDMTHDLSILISESQL